MLRRLSLILIFAIAASVFAARPFALAQTSSEIQAQQTELQKQLKEIERQIADYEKQLKDVRSEKNTLANKLKQLNAQRAKLNLQVQQTKALLNETLGKLDATQSQIAVQGEKLEMLHRQMGVVLQELHRQDQRGLIEILLSGSDLSGFFAQVNGYAQINEGLSVLLDQTKRLEASLKKQEETLVEQKQQQENLVAIAQLQTQEVATTISAQDALLQQTKGKETNYQSALSDTKKRASEIKNRIYNLIEVGKKVTFGEAVAVADWASSHTGVRSAFLLAILTQESNLGKNVGTCNRANDPPSKSWRVVMKPSRDHEPFKNITSSLNLPIDTTPVSCPMKDAQGNQVGWGGAMGPAQFIPSTWASYAPKVEAISGKTANPWDMRDAFLASAIYLKALGAGNQSGEWTAAMKYFSGSTNLKYRFYGDNVVKLAEQYQEDIDELKK
ncbi:MAG: lytic murein transglycosylase [Patescibacteria group bacterium]|nr:MAG: lytic murein transglycosylase [Patescibacteria group bacterium]